MKHLLLFDIDGTLVRMKQGRSRAIFKQAFAEVFSTDVPDEVFGGFAGRTDLQILRDIAQSMGLDANMVNECTNEFFLTLTRCFQDYSSTEHVDILPGVQQIVAHLHERGDILLFLLTGNVRECAYMKLTPYNLDGFFVDGAFGEISDSRSALPPHALQKANALVNQQRFHSANTIVIGDTLNDIRCARDNNMRVLGVGTGEYSREELLAHQPDGYVDSFADFAVSLQTIEGLLS